VKHRNAAVYFNRESIFDGYVGNLIFRGQIRNFNDASSTGATLRRRALSVAPGTILPVRRCLQVSGLRWLAGIGLTDTFQGQAVRETYNLRVGSSLLEVLTPAQACSPLASINSSYGYEEFFKDLQDSSSSSAYETFWNIFFAPIEPVSAGAFLRSGTRLLRVRQTYINAEQLRVAESDELDADWSQTAVFTNLGAYDPVTDTYATTTVSVQAVQMDIFKFYRWRIEAEAGRKPGDKTVFVPASAAPTAGSTFTMAAAAWRVLAVQPELDALAIHARPA
jgi:hypothetical protein